MTAVNTAGSLSGKIVVISRSAPERSTKPPKSSSQAEISSKTALPAFFPRMRRVSSARPSFSFILSMSREMSQIYRSISGMAAGADSQAALPASAVYPEGNRRRAGAIRITVQRAKSWRRLKR